MLLGTDLGHMNLATWNFHAANDSKIVCLTRTQAKADNQSREQDDLDTSASGAVTNSLSDFDDSFFNELPAVSASADTTPVPLRTVTDKSDRKLLIDQQAADSSLVTQLRS